MPAELSPADTLGLRTALENARKSYSVGGVPIGAAIVYHGGEGGKEPRVIGQGHSNQRIQEASPILHGETATLKDAGRLKAEVYRKSTMVLYHLEPVQHVLRRHPAYKVPRLVIGENVNFMGDEDLLRSRGEEVVVVDDTECKELMRRFIAEKPEEWYEDIGEIPPSRQQ